MSRRHFLKDIFGMDYAQLKEMYIKYGTIKKLADRLGVTDRTVKNWMKEGNIQGIVHPTRERKGKSMNAMKRWIAENPDVKLPRSPMQIAELTGIPLPSVKSFFVRRKVRLAKWLERFPDVRTLNVTFRSTDMTYVPAQAIQDYEFKIDSYSLKIMMYGTRKTGSIFRVLFTPKQYESLFRTEPDHAN
jgi:hypothetical protein